MNEPPQRLGKGMIYAAWLVVIGLLVFIFNEILEKQHNPNQELTTQYHQDGAREVILQRNRSGHYVATGTINGQPVVFFLDTGATTVSIPAHMAQQLHLELGPSVLVSTANGTVTTYMTRIDRIALGQIELRDVRANINPHMQDDDILLGMSFLKQLEWSQRGNTLTIRQWP